jgi:phage-related minor tail protein
MMDERRREHDLEEDYVTFRFCDERDTAMKQRMSTLEESVKGLTVAYQKAVTQIAGIVGGLTFLGIVAGLLLQYFGLREHP